MTVAAVVLAALAASAAPVPHPASVSRSVCTVRGAEVVVDLRFQTASLLEALPTLDQDLDGRFTTEELEAARAAIGDYLLANWRVLPPPFEDAAAFPGRLVSLEFATDLRDLDQTFQWIDARFELEGDASARELVVHSELFTERDPYHRDFLSFTYGDEEPWEVLFRFGEHRWRFRSAELRRPEVRRTFFASGLREGRWRWLLLGFAAAGVVVAASAGRAAFVVLLWGVGVGVGLGLQALAPAPPARVVELAFPLVLAYVGAESLLRRTTRTPWIEAPLCGVATVLLLEVVQHEALDAEPLVGTARLGLLAAAAAWLAAGVVGTLFVAKGIPGSRLEAARVDDRPGIASRGLALALSAAAAVTGLAVFVLSTGWFE